MNRYVVTYKAGSNYATLPTEIEADGYNTAGRFIDFWRTGSGPYSRETVHRVAAEGVVHIELKSEGVQRD